MSEVTVSISDVQEVAREIYGDGAWEITKALSKEQKDRRTKIKENIALATNAGGAVAGPAAIYGAVRSRKQGGFFRDVGRAAGKKAETAPKPLKGTLRRAGKIASSLDKPMSTRAKVAAVTAGGTMVGLQGLNMAGDTIAAQMIRDKQKKDKAAVSKAMGVLKPLAPKAPKPPTQATGVMKPKMPTLNKPKQSSVRTPKMAPMVRKNYDFEARYEISKADIDKRQVFGWASVVEVDGEPVVDLQGDYATIDVIEKAAYDYVHTSRKGGDMHRREGQGVIHKSDLVESFVVTPEKKKMLGLPDSTPTGWWVGFQVNDDELWGLVKEGKRPQFSIHGSGQRVEKVL